MKNPHSVLKRETLLELSASGLGRFWNNETGVAIAAHFSGGDWKPEHTTRVIRFGLIGSSDIYGILNGGFFFGGEIKTGKGVQTDQQKNFGKMITSQGGLYIVIRSAVEAVKDIEKFLAGKI